MKEVIDLGVLAVTLLLMVTVGMELEARDFREMARLKGLVAATLLVPALILPVIALMVAQWFALPPHLTAGLLLLAACPVGDIANFYTLLARGNVAFSVSVNALSCLFSGVTMAVAFEFYEQVQRERFAFALPSTGLVLRLTLLVALPVLAGMALRHRYPAWVTTRRAQLRNLCLAGVAFLLAYVLVSRWPQVAADWRPTALAGIVFMVLALAVGLGLATALRLPPREHVTVGLLFAVRNVALASAVAVTVLGRIEFAVVAAVYFLVEVPLALGVAAAFRRWRQPAPIAPQFQG
jgi:bile acid:Na+ symporter, BASS family